MVDLYTKVISNIVFPLHEYLKGHHTLSVRHALEDSQWWTQDRLEQHQAERLKQLLIESNTHVPYYRKMFAKMGFDPYKCDDLTALDRLPFLTKQDIRDNLNVLKSERARELHRFNTGGSSGEPLIFFISKERISHDVAAKWRATRWWKVDIGDPEIVVWGSSIELTKQDRIKELRDKVFRTRLLSAFEMTQSNVEKYLKIIQRTKPKMLFGYPSAISYLAEYALEHNWNMKDLGVEVAFVTAEKSYSWQVEVIKKGFGCEVANGYGGRDAGFIAHECPAGGLHITAEDVIVEIVNEEGERVPQGGSGEIVVTHLATKDFPFIRYKTGDVGALGRRSCECGRGLPLLERVEGRTTDFIVTEDGSVIHGLALIYVIRDIPGIKVFRIVQETKTRINLFLVPSSSLDNAYLDSIEEEFKKRLGDNIDLRINVVAQLPPERSGKHRYVISRVTPQ